MTKTHPFGDSIVVLMQDIGREEEYEQSIRDVFFYDLNQPRSDKFAPPKELSWKLFAAAPELLEACKKILDRYTSLASSGDCGFWNPYEEEAVILCEKAIAKAEGVVK